MYKIYSSIAVFICLLLNINAQSSNGTGSWLLTKVIENGEEQDVYVPIEFLEDGIMSTDGYELGTWEYDLKKQIFSISSEMFDKLDGKQNVL
ncbi:MAG: hypothetical protein PF450_13470, partial [Bacteroidales bacterium]|nr:hypothetical protein [Bacteroidales bacterium]